MFKVTVPSDAARRSHYKDPRHRGTFPVRVPISNNVKEGLRKNWSFPDPLGTPYTESELLERRSETRRSLKDSRISLRRSENGVFVNLRKSSSKWTVCRDLAIVSSHDTKSAKNETKVSKKRSSSTVSEEDDLKPVPNDLNTPMSVKMKRPSSEPCVLVVTVDSDDDNDDDGDGDDDNDAGEEKKKSKMRKRYKRNSRALIRSTRGDSTTNKKFGVMMSTSPTSSPRSTSKDESTGDVILVTPSDESEDEQQEIVSPRIRQPALERKSSSLLAKTSFEGTMDVAVFSSSSKITWSENLNVELLNGTLCWYNRRASERALGYARVEAYV